MGQTANQMAIEMLVKIKDKIKQRKEEKQKKAGSEWWENHNSSDNRNKRCKDFGGYF